MPREIFNSLDSETWHLNAIQALHFAESNQFTLKVLDLFIGQKEKFKSEKLKVILGGIEFENPIMVGAGWDKTGKAVKALNALGFSGVEVGTVLAYPQTGNPKPRQFMIGPGVALNSLGFNSPGVEVVAKNLERYNILPKLKHGVSSLKENVSSSFKEQSDKNSPIPIGISLGKNKDVDDINTTEAYAIVVKKLYDHASYFVINVSSPNTPGLRKFQEKRLLTDIVLAVKSAMRESGGEKPTFIKIDPELVISGVDGVIEVVLEQGLAGIIATNTTNRESIKAKYGKAWKEVPGGVSGNDDEFRKMATEKIAHIYKETKGQIEIIGVGGVNSTESALEKIKAGAKVVQVVTAIREIGPYVAIKINKGILEYMEREGIRNLEEIRGSGTI